MGNFQGSPVRLDATFGTQNTGAEASFPRVLQISVSNAQQVINAQQGLPKLSPTANTVLLFGGTARFGMSDEGSRDADNIPNNEAIMVDDGELKTLQLQLHMQQQQLLSGSLGGSASFTALNSVSLDTTDFFGANTNNAITELTSVDPTGQPIPKDFWLFSDVYGGENCALNRLGYQATVLLQTATLATPIGSEIPVPHSASSGQAVELDVANPGHVATPKSLDVGIIDGLQVFPADGATNGANRLLIFTGTAICNVMSPLAADAYFNALVRVRLRFPLPATLIFKGSASVASLASIHGNHDLASLFGVNAAKIVTDPTDGGSLGQPTPPLPDSELYLIADLIVVSIKCPGARSVGL